MGGTVLNHLLLMTLPLPPLPPPLLSGVLHDLVHVAALLLLLLFAVLALVVQNLVFAQEEEDPLPTMAWTSGPIYLCLVELSLTLYLSPEVPLLAQYCCLR